MSKLVTVLIAALAAGWMVAASATGASAHFGHKPCNCGPLHPTFRIHTVHPESSYTRYHDKSVTRSLPRYHRIVTITQVQPIVHIHDVTRIHHHTVFYVKDTYASETRHLSPLTYVDHSTRNIYEGCGCQ